MLSYTVRRANGYNFHYKKHNEMLVVAQLGE